MKLDVSLPLCQSNTQLYIVAKSRTHALEKCFDSAFGHIGSTVQNLRLVWVKFLKVHDAFMQRNA